MNKLMQYKRENDNKLYLYVNDNDQWVRFNKHKFYQADYDLSSKSGFRTSQFLLKQGYNFLPIDN